MNTVHHNRFVKHSLLLFDELILFWMCYYVVMFMSWVHVYDYIHIITTTLIESFLCYFWTMIYFVYTKYNKAWIHSIKVVYINSVPIHHYNWKRDTYILHNLAGLTLNLLTTCIPFVLSMLWEPSNCTVYSVTWKPRPGPIAITLRLRYID